MAKDKGLRPGQTAPKSGQYEQVGPRGGKGKEVTVTKGLDASRPEAGHDLQPDRRDQEQVGGQGK